MAKLEGAAASNRYFENEKVREAIRNDIYQEALNADD